MPLWPRWPKDINELPTSRQSKAFAAGADSRVNRGSSRVTPKRKDRERKAAVFPAKHLERFPVGTARPNAKRPGASPGRFRAIRLYSASFRAWSSFWLMTFVTPSPCMDTPNRVSAISMVRRWWVIMMSWVSSRRLLM